MLKPPRWLVLLAQLAFAAVAAGQSTTSAQSTAQPTGQTFKAGTDIIPVEVSVVDGNGQPVTGLRPEDFSVAVEGLARPIRSVQWIATRNELPLPARPPREANVSVSASGGANRLLVIAVDEGHLGFGTNQAIVRTAARLMDRLGAGDLVAVARLPGGGGVEFTSNRSRIEDALRQVKGTTPAPQLSGRVYLTEAIDLANGARFEWPRALQRECGQPPNPRERGLGLCAENLALIAHAMLVEEDAKAVALLGGLERLVASLADTSVPATIVLISEGLHLGVREGLLGRLTRVAGASRVTLHVVKPALAAVDIRDHSAPPSPAAEDAVLRDGLEKLADQMGGEFRTAVASGEGAFAAVAAELSGYYLLGIEPAAADRTGRPRDIRVTVSRRGARVIARRFFVVEDATSLRRTGPGMERLLVGAVPASGVALKVATYQTLDDDADKVRVLLSAEIGSPVEAPQLLDVGYVLLDDSGRVVHAESGRHTVTPSRDGVPSPGLYVAAFSAPPGDYVVRFGAIAPDGNEGSVHHSLRLTLTRRPGNLLLSDLLVGVEPACGGPPRFAPSAIVDGPRAAAVLQIAAMDRTPSHRVSVRFELVAERDGPLLGRWAAGALPSAQPGRHEFSGAIPLHLVPPGEYLLRAVVTTDVDTVVERHFRFEPGRVTDFRAALRSTTAVASRFLDLDDVRDSIDALRRLHPVSAALDVLVNEARAGRFVTAPETATRPREDVAMVTFVGGLAALQSGKIALARTLFEFVQRVAPDFREARFYIGAAHALNHDDQLAIEAWQSLRPDWRPSTLAPPLVEALLRRGRFDAAASVVSQSLDAWPTDDAGLLLLSMQLLYMRSLETSLTEAETARFGAWADHYEGLGGEWAGLVRAWRQALRP
jgi:VWFA-related protein